MIGFFSLSLSFFLYHPCVKCLHQPLQNNAVIIKLAISSLTDLLKEVCIRCPSFVIHLTTVSWLLGPYTSIGTIIEVLDQPSGHMLVRARRSLYLSCRHSSFHICSQWADEELWCPTPRKETQIISSVMSSLAKSHVCIMIVILTLFKHLSPVT